MVVVVVADYAECRDLVDGGMLQWVSSDDRLSFRIILNLPNAPPPFSPASFSVTVPLTYPNTPPAVQDTATGTPVPNEYVPILSEHAWLPVYSMRDVVIAIITALYDVRMPPPLMRACFPPVYHRSHTFVQRCGTPAGLRPQLKTGLGVAMALLPRTQSRPPPSRLTSQSPLSSPVGVSAPGSAAAFASLPSPSASAATTSALAVPGGAVSGASAHVSLTERAPSHPSVRQSAHGAEHRAPLSTLDRIARATAAPPPPAPPFATPPLPASSPFR